MTARGLTMVALMVLGVAAWRAELVQVEPRGTLPALLRVLPVARRHPAAFDASLPMVPVGVRRVAPGNGVLVVHYWAAWEHHSGPQAVALDSLRRTLPPGAVEFAVVCFDPYPSVTRYVARMRLRLPVLLDVQHALSGRLPCPSMPYTYVVDPAGRIAVEQGGEVDWLAPGTRAALAALAQEAGTSSVPTAAPITLPNGAARRPAKRNAPGPRGAGAFRLRPTSGARGSRLA